MPIFMRRLKKVRGGGGIYACSELLFGNDINTKLNEIGKENLITIAVTSDIYAPEFRKGMMLQLVTEEDNIDDGDAIAVYLDNDKVGYVANSDGTCCGMTSRASDIRIEEIAFAEYLFYYIDTYHVAKMIW